MQVREEEQKQGRIQEEIALLRALLGGSAGEGRKRGSREAGGREGGERRSRRRRRATDEVLPPCPSTSPELLGTLVVRQEPVLTMQQVQSAAVALGEILSVPTLKIHKKKAANFIIMVFLCSIS